MGPRLLPLCALTLLSAILPPAAPAGGADLLRPEDFVYLGAFRLPGGEDRPQTFAYGGNAMTYNPAGDPEGGDDGFPGSLFITGHDRLPYGELPDGGQVAEVAIPVPAAVAEVGDLPQAGFVQPFRNVFGGRFPRMAEIPRIGLAYLDHRATGPKLHVAWGQHFEPDPTVPTHAWISPTLSAPRYRGTWYLKGRSFYATTGYLLEIPAAWARRHASSRPLGTGRFRDGGWSGMGPALFAYRPWVDRRGTPARRGARLASTRLLQYRSSETTEEIRQCLDGYQHPDEWEGGAWLTTSDGRTAVLFAGTKGTGAKYWYGFVNPAGPDLPCVEEELVGQFTLCRLADGTPCPPEDLEECAGHGDYRGWWSARFDARFILYDPEDLARVAAGEMKSWQPQPYAQLDVDDLLYRNPEGVEEEMLGRGDQRRYRLGDVAYDRTRDLLYVLEPFAQGARPVVHVWRLRGIGASRLPGAAGGRPGPGDAVRGGTLP